MNQFIAAWEFALKNFQYLFLLVLPVMVSEMLVAYLLIPIDGMDPMDINEYMSGNVASIMIVSLIAIVLSVSLTGGLMVAYQSIMSQEASNPINALSDANTVLDLQYLENVLHQAKIVHEMRLELLDKFGVDNVHPE